MISRDDVMPLLLGACPSFAPTWQRIEPYNEDEEGRLHYADAGEFAQHLVDLMRCGQGDEIGRSFNVIETLHVDGDPYVRELATIGFLEAVQNIAGNSPDVTPDDFLHYLGPETRRWWRGLNAFWSGAAPAVQATDE